MKSIIYLRLFRLQFLPASIEDSDGLGRVQVGPMQIGSLQHSPMQYSPVQVGPVQIRLGQIRVNEVGSVQVRLVKISRLLARGAADGQALGLDLSKRPRGRPRRQAAK